ncbi:hypothetical protein EYF80_004959 [Liparis tanakae]|uniref:Uncharacterized protein n=1 Tax=Liparis tanakae TaxID=230148 RepID=A0A4Z2J4U3_9TELE|nr:hypothetical protein EYF80_004959 [Liparis tanakae]
MEKTRSYHSCVCCPDSLRRVAHGGGRATPRYATPRYATPRHAALRHATLRHAALCVVMGVGGLCGFR